MSNGVAKPSSFHEETAKAARLNHDELTARGTQVPDKPFTEGSWFSAAALTEGSRKLSNSFAEGLTDFIAQRSSSCCN